MTHSKTRMLVAIMLVLATISLYACTSPSSTQTSDAPAVSNAANAPGDVKEPAKSEAATDPAPAESTGEPKNLIIGTYMNVTTLLPWKTTSNGDYDILRQIYSYVVDMNSKSQATPNLAEKWEVTSDGLEWTLHLRDGFYWHTGNELFGDEKVQVTAEDVKFTFEYNMSEESGSTRTTELLEVVDHLEVVDPLTVKVIMKQIDVLFEYKMAMIAVLPKKAFDTGWDLNEFPIGSGAYKFVRHVIDSEVYLEKNTDFWMAPGLDSITYQIIPDRSVAAIALQNEEIDLVRALLPTDVGAIASKDYLTLTDAGSGSLRWVGFQCERPPFNDRELRRAIMSAIDIDGAIQAIFQNDANAKIAVRAWGPLPIEKPGGGDQERIKAVAPQYDTAAAVAAIEGLGWAKGSDGIYAKDGEKLSFVLQVGNNDASREKLAVIISSQLKAIGIDCTAKTAEWATHLTDMDNGVPAMFVIGGYSGLDGAWKLMGYDPKTYSPNAKYKNDEVEALLKQASITVDNAARAEILTKANEIFTADAPIIPTWYEYMQTGYNNKVVGYDYYPTPDFPLCGSERNVTFK